MPPLDRPPAERARSRRLGQHLLLLHLTGRRTGRRIDVPVAYHQVDDDELLVLTNSAWRCNLRSTANVEVTRNGRRSSATARLVEEPERVADVYQGLFAQVGRAGARRRLGMRIDVDRTPTHAALADAARREGLSLVYLRPSGTSS